MKELADELRRRLEVDESQVSDDQILADTEGTFLRAGAEMSLALRNLGRELEASSPAIRWLCNLHRAGK